MRLGDKVLGVKRATADYGMPGAAWVPPIGSAPGFAPGSLPGTETECVRLTNMVTREELTDPTEAREILEDTQEECAGFGKLTRVLMPLPKLSVMVLVSLSRLVLIWEKKWEILPVL